MYDRELVVGSGARTKAPHALSDFLAPLMFSGENRSRGGGVVGLSNTRLAITKCWYVFCGHPPANVSLNRVHGVRRVCLCIIRNSSNCVLARICMLPEPDLLQIPNVGFVYWHGGGRVIEVTVFCFMATCHTTYR